MNNQNNKRTIDGIGNKLFRCHIVVYEDPRTFKEITTWRGLRFELLCKYKWYFDYRAALLKVKYPKLKVELSTASYEPETRSEKEIVFKNIKNLWIAKKRKITEIENKLNLARKTWDRLFPIEDDHLYKKAVNKLQYITGERDKYKEQMDSLSN